MTAAKASAIRAAKAAKQRVGVVAAFVFDSPDLALITRIRNLAEFASQCVSDFWENKTDIGFFVGSLRRCEYEMSQIKTEGKLRRLGEIQRYFLELSEEVSSLLNLAAEAAVRQEPIDTPALLKSQVRMQYLSSALVSESRFAMNGSPI